jgi:hypothetical protein
VPAGEVVEVFTPHRRQRGPTQQNRPNRPHIREYAVMEGGLVEVLDPG